MARYLSISALGFCLAATGARADNSGPASTDNTYTRVDPDGVPYSVTEPHQRPLSQAELESAHRQDEEMAAKKNWLLSSYEQQVQEHAKANASNASNANLYLQLSSNKELAKLSGLPVLDSSSEDATTYRTGAIQSGPSAVTLRDPAPSSATNIFRSHGNLFQPLVTPLSAPEAAGLHNFYSSQPYGMRSPLSSYIPPSHTQRADPVQESSDLETPGMVAAEKDPLTDTSSSDLSLDILPGESVEQARAHQDNNASLELPLPMDADQLHRAQASSLIAPNTAHAAATSTTTTAPTLKAAPVVDPEAPTPVSQVPQINPVRTPIASPYDILDR